MHTLDSIIYNPLQSIYSYIVQNCSVLIIDSACTSQHFGALTSTLTQADIGGRNGGKPGDGISNLTLTMTWSPFGRGIVIGMGIGLMHCFVARTLTSTQGDLLAIQEK